MRFSAVRALSEQRRFVLDYHADTVAIGRQAEDLGVSRLVLTHLIPPPGSEADEQAFEDDVRSGGYTGDVVVARDLTTLTLP